MSNAGHALRKMAQAKHIGKIVLSLSEPAPQIQVPTRQSIQVRKDSSYLISGGLGGLGLSVARWLAQQGAGSSVCCREAASETMNRRHKSSHCARWVVMS